MRSVLHCTENFVKFAPHFGYFDGIWSMETFNDRSFHFSKPTTQRQQPQPSAIQITSSSRQWRWDVKARSHLLYSTQRAATAATETKRINYTPGDKIRTNSFFDVFQLLSSTNAFPSARSRCIRVLLLEYHRRSPVVVSRSFIVDVVPRSWWLPIRRWAIAG